MGTLAGEGLALVRIAFGLYFIASAWKKTLNNWFADGTPVAEFVTKNLPQAEAFYRPFLERTVLPNADTFADLVLLGEWVAGLSLTLGLLTRLGALTSLLLVLNFAIAKGLPNLILGPTVSTDLLFLASAVACMIGAAGLVWGLDGALRHAWARYPLTRWLAGIPAGHPRRRVAVHHPTPIRHSRLRRSA